MRTRQPGLHCRLRLCGLLAVAAMLGAAALPAGPPAPQLPLYSAGQPREQTMTFVVGNVQFVLVHELAHLLIGEFDVPIIGPEESAADYLAAAALIRTYRRDPAQNQRYRDYLLAAADALALSWRKRNELGAPIPFWDSHALDIQRFYEIVCLLAGADPETYADLPARIGMPAERASGCAAEFRRTDRALNWLIGTYGHQAGKRPGAAIAIRYEDPPTRVSADIIAEIRRLGLIEDDVNRLTELFALPRPATVVVRRCGRAEAAWQPEHRELVLCYDLLDAFYRLSLSIKARS